MVGLHRCGTQTMLRCNKPLGGLPGGPDAECDH